MADLQLDPPLAWLPYATFTAYKQERRIEYWWPTRQYVWVVASDIGRGDPVPPENPDAFIDESANLYGAPLKRRKVWDRVVKLFETNGPMTAQEIATAMGMKKPRVTGMLGAYIGHCERLGYRYEMVDGKLTWERVYGLPGQTIPYEWGHPVMELLRGGKWYTQPEIAKATGYSVEGVSAYLRRHEDRIRSVERTKVQAGREYIVKYFQLKPAYWENRDG